MTAHASKKTNHLQSAAAQPSLPFQGTSWGFQAKPTQRRVIIKGSLKKRLRQTKQIRKFSKEKCQLTFNLLNAGGAHGDAEHLERSKQNNNNKLINNQMYRQNFTVRYIFTSKKSLITII